MRNILSNMQKRRICLFDGPNKFHKTLFKKRKSLKYGNKATILNNKNVFLTDGNCPFKCSTESADRTIPLSMCDSESRRSRRSGSTSYTTADVPSFSDFPESFRTFSATPRSSSRSTSLFFLEPI